MNTFENNLSERFSDANISQSSQKLYFSNLRRLNGGAPLTDFKFLDKPEVIADKLKDYAATTQRNFYIAIVSALNLGGTAPKHKKLYSKYYDLMLNKNKEVKEIKHDPEGLPKWNDITEKRNALATQVGEFWTNKQLSPLQYEMLLKWVVVSLYTLQAPRRNGDYLNAFIVDKNSPQLAEDRNYITLKEPQEFIFHKYKTDKKYGTQTEPVEPELQRVLNIYYKHHPLLVKGRLPKDTPAVKFLVYADGEPVSQLNAITRILNSALGKGTGSSKLRHAYLTDKYGKLTEAQAEDAEKMGHSVAQQKDYIYTK
jgi:integrase